MASKFIGKMTPTRVTRIRNAQRLYHTRRITTISTQRYDEIPEKTEKKEAKAAPLAPLSGLPTAMLLRSVCINSVSSKPLLLNPALSILFALCKPNRGFLLNVDRNPLLHSILKGTFYKQFCAGETASEVTATIRHMRKMGFRGTILTYAKETVFDHATNTSHGLGVASTDDGGAETCENIAAWAEGTLKTVDLLEEGDQLALKYDGPSTSEKRH